MRCRSAGWGLFFFRCSYRTTAGLLLDEHVERFCPLGRHGLGTDAARPPSCRQLDHCDMRTASRRCRVFRFAQAGGTGDWIGTDTTGFRPGTFCTISRPRPGDTMWPTALLVGGSLTVFAGIAFSSLLTDRPRSGRHPDRRRPGPDRSGHDRRSGPMAPYFSLADAARFLNGHLSRSRSDLRRSASSRKQPCFLFEPKFFHR